MQTPQRSGLVGWPHVHVRARCTRHGNKVLNTNAAQDTMQGAAAHASQDGEGQLEGEAT